MSYYRPTAVCEVSQVIKKSQFIAQLAPVENTLQAHEFIQRIKARHPNASHNCHCFIAAAPADFSSWGYSDDGEPKGCAGLPMFNVLKHADLGQVCIVVTRYFGGIKLGTGGMARAYSATVNLVLQACDRQLVLPTSEITIHCPFHLSGIIEHSAKQISGVVITDRTWVDKGQKITLLIEQPSRPEFNVLLSPYLHQLTIECDD